MKTLKAVCLSASFFCLFFSSLYSLNQCAGIDKIRIDLGIAVLLKKEGPVEDGMSSLFLEMIMLAYTSHEVFKSLAHSLKLGRRKKKPSA